jgi:hypothetical protein
MTEQNVDIVVRAREITQAAFAQVEKELSQLEGKAKDVGDKSDGAGKGLLSFGGSLTTMFAGAGVAIGAAVTAVSGITAGIIALGTKGADVADIRSNFDKLNESIGLKGPASLKTLKGAFAGTISDFDLMKMSNSALSLGLKASNTDFDLLGKAARTLADRVGIDAKDAFATITEAMATGKDKMLKKVKVMIDAEQAMYSYAKSIGKTVEDLTMQEKVDAKSIAIKERLKEILAESGEAEYDFADAVSAAKVMVGNFTDSLGEAIATSPAIQSMLMSFKTGFEGAFGADQEAIVKTLVGYVNQFALVLVDVARFGVDTASFIYRAWSYLKLEFAAIGTAITFVLEAIVTNLSHVINAAAAIPMVGDKFRGVADTVKDAALQIKGMRQSFVEQTKEAWAGVTANSEFERVARGIDGTLVGVKKNMLEAMSATKAMNEKVKGGVPVLKDFDEGLVKLTKSQKEAIKEKEKLNKEIINFEKGIKNLMFYGMEPGGKAFKDMKVTAEEFYKSLPPLNTELTAKKLVWAEMPKGIKDTESAIKKLKAETGSFGQMFKDTFKQIPNVMLDAIKGGGNVVQAVGSTLGLGIGNQVVKSFGTKITGALGSTLGGAFNAVIPGLGALLGPLASSIGGFFSRMFGGISKEVKEARVDVENFQKQLAATLTEIQKQDAGGQTWKMTMIAVRDAYLSVGKTAGEAELIVKQLWNTDNPKAAKAAIEEITRVMGGLKKEEEDVWAVAQKYGFTLEELGPKLRTQKLDEQAKTLQYEFGILTKSGIDVGDVTKRMADETNKYLKIALTTGTEVPLSMKPMLEKMAEMGVLIGEDGEKLTDLQNIPFAKSMSEGFKDVVTAIGDMTKVLKDAFGSAVGEASTFAGSVRNALSTIPRSIDIDIHGNYRQDNLPKDDDEGFAVGGIVSASVFGEPVLLHGHEAIVPLDRPSVIGSQMVKEIVSVASQATPGQGRAVNFELQEVAEAMRLLVTAVIAMPGQITRATRDGMLQAGVGGRR